jgi:structural maintenance of chromosome 4
MLKQTKNLDKMQQQFETERIDLNHKIEKMNTELAHETQESERYRHLLGTLKLHDIDALNDEDNQVQDADGEENNGPALNKLEADDLLGVDVERLKKEIHHLENELKSLSPNLVAIQSYRELLVKFRERVNELDEVTMQRDELCNKFEELRKKRLDEFMYGFTKIRLKLKEIYRTVTLEGDAELELVDSLDPFTEGIVLSVRPPKKSWKNVSNLSGGEKTLSSLSLVFALHEFRSTPIYVMDEIDAALDFKNVSIIAHYIKVNKRFNCLFNNFG